MNIQKYWKLAERYLEEFFYPDSELQARFEKYKNDSIGDLGRFDEFLYAYDEFYIVRDLFGWSYPELMDWVDQNVDKINELYAEVYGPEYKNVYERET